MALGNRYKSAPGAGTLAALILVLVFGSPWYAEWAVKNADPETAGGWFLNLLAWPRWSFDSSDSLREIIVTDLKAILLVVLTALFLYLLPGSQLSRARGTISQLFSGWAAYVFAGGFAALFTTLFLANPSLITAFRAAADVKGSGQVRWWSEAAAPGPVVCA